MNYPNLNNIGTISLDLETKDVDLRKLGPGCFRSAAGMSDDRILCVAIATHDNEWCFDWNDNTRQWLQDTIHDKNLILANAVYDMSWLSVNGVTTTGTIYDILTNESLIDAARHPGQWFNLEYCTKKYLGQLKQNDPLKEYADLHDIKYKKDVREVLYLIYEMDPELVQTYGKADARQTYDVYQKQKKHIYDMQLDTVFKLESDLNTVLLRMRRNGVKIDVANMERRREETKGHIIELQSKCNYIACGEINVNSGKQMLKAFEFLGLPHAKTEKGNPSFKSEILEHIDHEFTRSVLELRELQKLESTFFSGLERFLVGDRIHAEFIPVKNGNRGAETRRFSSQRPNLQQIPSNGIGKKLIRSLFIPENDCVWVKQDQSQEEYRVFAHYARGRGAEQLRRDFRKEGFDMHSWVQEFCRLPDRKTAKAVNFLSLYGGGVHKFATVTGLPEPPAWRDFTILDNYQDQKEYMIAHYEAAKLYFQVHDNLQCIKKTAKAAQEVAKQRGYAKTILGGRRYLNGYFTKDALNSTIQGTCGDIMKKWLVDCEKSGLWDILPLHINCHDETGLSMPDTKEALEAAQEVKRIGETCITFNVPLKVDMETGPNWADVEEI